MGWFIGILLFIALLIVWCYADFHLGLYLHKKRWKKRSYSMRKGHLELITNGPDLFETYFKDLREAKSSIHILFYIVKNDRFSQVFWDVLMDKARQGVKVRLLLDWLGSRHVRKNWIKNARSNGIDVAFCHVPRLPFLIFTLQQRNHRKITIIDNYIGYLGGYNIGKEYIDLEPKLSPWRDYHIRLKGEGISDLQNEFMADWVRATKKNKPEFEDNTIDKEDLQMLHRFYPSEGVGAEYHLLKLIDGAKTSIIIGTPYFIPTEAIIKSIEAALNRGVSLTVLVPDTADHAIVKEASFRYLRRVLAAGGQVYQFGKGFFHAKVTIVDGEICDIGTANFDQRSILLNHEINCYIYDKTFIADVEKALAEDISHSHPMSLEKLNNVSIGVRIKEWLGRAIEGLL
ncbi:cardiolipin synthase [Lederbergia wuyishanensis]|uniref:Cardiolipin synthase n=1 Tax=Lederbergia wuyishanensis TaxID=1347903 RepID=A0ABU0D3G3_9BACI|nr:cardiolipin synthase [Lederbergia wuyishanensis]MCJ8007885.1 cardiolipin synthase [Lederbergia wuyishanensis]MDQ0342948.1 cardiolipin synthase [Lederbergia wuyishanensis]